MATKKATKKVEADPKMETLADGSTRSTARRSELTVQMKSKIKALKLDDHCDLTKDELVKL